MMLISYIFRLRMVRLPMSPPHFPPALNSYQRLLVHRLADTFGIKREVEAITPSAWAAVVPAASAMNVPTGIVVLVKGDAAKVYAFYFCESYSLLKR